jgi:hypothetical protein
MLRLSQDASDYYQKNGYYLFHKPVFSDQKFSALSAIFEGLLIKNPDKRLDTLDTLDTPHFDEPELLDFLLADEVLDLVAPLIGPDIGLWSSHFICKEPRTGRATRWHEDSRYWHGRFDHFTGIVTIWLAIDKVDRENGCMKVIPGSHRAKSGIIGLWIKRPIHSAPKSSASMSVRPYILSWSPMRVPFTIRA